MMGKQTQRNLFLLLTHTRSVELPLSERAALRLDAYFDFHEAPTYLALTRGAKKLFAVHAN